MSGDSIAHHAALDRRLPAAVRGVRLLTSVSWPASEQARFLDGWRGGRLRLPVIDYPRTDHAETRRELDAIVALADKDDPLGGYLIRNAQSWSVATRLLEAAGTPMVSVLSAQLYGRPGERVPGSQLSHVDAARHFIALADELSTDLIDADDDPGIAASDLQAELQRELDAYFGGRVVRVDLDPDLIAKAAAGATRIRIKSGSRFSVYDRRQLLEHEAFVHSLTALNGREQAVLPSLALGSPRSTATQEGLAVFAELVSGSIDLARLKRISLRTLAIQQALDGADFVDVFRYFLDAGQDDAESFASAQRVFRGVPLGGGAAFGKDAVYLGGLLSVHAFFREALATRRLDRCRNLFAGKLALDDVVALESSFGDGAIAPPRWLPPWMRRAGATAGWLAFSLFANRIPFDRLVPGSAAVPPMPVDRQTGAV